jgi:hypothetical protein
MNHRRIWITALAGLAAVAGAARAEGFSAANTGAAAPAEFAYTGAPSGARFDAVRYQPRSHRGGFDSGRAAGESPTQIHIGFFEPDGNGATSFAFGIRGGPQVDEHVQIGVGADWYHKSESQRVVVGDPYVVNGNIVRPTRVLSRASSDLIPLELFMQLSGSQDMQVIPYGGIAGGYQYLLLSATDYQTRNDFNATYGGWGWQAWGGAALPLSGRSRLFGEVFVNQGDVERDVTDSAGNDYREGVSADGVGMRFGVSWGF